ncbi:MAG: alpha-glucosidase/alpha-galactosidase [Oliverpabstia sp.]
MREDLSNVKIAYIGGGSRGWAWNFMADLALEPDFSGSIYLYDLDKEAAENNAVIGNKITADERAVGKWNYVVADTLQDALTDAEFVIISILPGTFDEMESDVHAPEKYGIYQSVGDTVGPGGILRALRTVPMYVTIAEAIKAYAPDAWVINYTNPMTVCVRTLYEVFPEIKAFGCCHEVFGTQELLADMLEDMYGVESVKREEIKINVMGINHFTWISKAAYREKDLFSLYEQFVDKYYETGYERNEGDRKKQAFSCAHRVKFDLFKKYGLIAAAGDRHLAEFMPPWYLKDPETAEAWRFQLTSVEFRKKQLEERLEQSRRLRNGEENVEIKPSGEEGVRLIKAILGLENIVSNVNLPNYGQIANLPKGVVVETNALFSRDSVAPIVAGSLPGDILSLVSRHVNNQENIVKAAISRDYDLAFHAFMNDPLVKTDLEKGEELFKTMLHNTEKYLPGWNL